MSLRFYHTPKGDKSRRSSPITDEDCKKYSDSASRAKKWIPPTLHLEELVRNSTMPPCSLNEFMDYLVYVERDAEALQFFLWYCGYVRRWTELPIHERCSTPKWDPFDGEMDADAQARIFAERKRRRGPRVSRPGKDRRRRNASKVSNILDILQDDEESYTPSIRSSSSSGAPLVSFGISSPMETQTLTSLLLVVVPPQSQPFRDEITQITARYIHATGPRSLTFLTPQDRAAVQAATFQTTHPSALLPAFEKAHSLLRGKLHPNFVRSSMANANRPQTVLLRLLGVFLTLLGWAALAALLLFSARYGLSRYWRVACFGFWFPGFAILVAAVDGVSILLYFRRLRQLRPWEKSLTPVDLEKANCRVKGHVRRGTADSIFTAGGSGADPLRKNSLRPFGPRNDFASEGWVWAHERTGIWWRVFEETGPAGECAELSVLRDGVVIGAVIWAVVLAGGLAAGAVFIPAYDVFQGEWA